MRGGSAGSSSPAAQPSSCSASVTSASLTFSTCGSTLVRVARGRLEDQLALADALGQGDGGRDGRVPAEGHLRLRTEVTHREGPVGARNQERGFRVADRGGDAEHGGVV